MLCFLSFFFCLLDPHFSWSSFSCNSSQKHPHMFLSTAILQPPGSFAASVRNTFSLGQSHYEPNTSFWWVCDGCMWEVGRLRFPVEIPRYCLLIPTRWQATGQKKALCNQKQLHVNQNLGFSLAIAEKIKFSIKIAEAIKCVEGKNIHSNLSYLNQSTNALSPL